MHSPCFFYEEHACIYFWKYYTIFLLFPNGYQFSSGGQSPAPAETTHNTRAAVPFSSRINVAKEKKQCMYSPVCTMPAWRTTRSAAVCRFHIFIGMVYVVEGVKSRRRCLSRLPPLSHAWGGARVVSARRDVARSIDRSVHSPRSIMLIGTRCRPPTASQASLTMLQASSIRRPGIEISGGDRTDCVDRERAPVS